MACEYPDASSPKEFWNNIISKRISFREVPKERIDLIEYSDQGSPDSIYIKNAGVIEGYLFDREKYKISGSAYRSTDMVHWLALDVASRALDDAGFYNGNGLNKKNTGVIVGNTLTGEFSRSSLTRLRWPYFKKFLLNELNDKENIEEFLLNLEKKFKQPFEPPNEDSLAGGLSNTIAGRICNYFDLKGGGFAVDGACSSSLLAVINACNFIESGAMDAVLVGGVDLSLDPFELVGFSRLGAMAKEEMRVYDKNPTGFIPGEGCGFVLLMNSEIAFSLGVRSYAIIKGWGISSDGHGGITRPEIEGQKIALKRAYKKANYSIDTVAFFEGHGTGTSIGDMVELTALSETLSRKNHIPVVGSVKPNIGHTKAAAGIAGLIKTVMSVNTQLIAPMTGLVEPNEIFEKQKIKIIKDAEIWPDGCYFRAGVSSFGFGGINSHITIESTSNLRRKKITRKEKMCIQAEQSAEIFLFSSSCYMELKKQIEELLEQNISRCEMTDLSIDLISNNKNKKIRCSIVAKNPEDFKNKLKKVLYEINNRGEKTKLFLFEKNGIFLCEEKLKLGLMFPGQASPVRFNFGSFGFKRIKSLYKKYFKNFSNELKTDDAQSCIILSELAGLELLSSFGAEANVAIGHSLGELCALYWSGALNKKELLELVKNRGNFMLNNSPEGAMLAVYSEECEQLEELVKKYDLEISAYNSHKQLIVSGSSDGIDSLVNELNKKEIKSLLLPVKKPFHSRLMKDASLIWENFLKKYSFGECKNKIISTVTGEFVEKNIIKKNLIDQFTKPVLFKQSFEKFLKECDFCLEVGPGGVLGNLCEPARILSLDCCGSSIEKMLIGVAAVYTIGGQNLDFDLLKNRYHKKYKHKKTFFSNQCESTKNEFNFGVLEKKEVEKKEVIESENKKPIDIFKEILSKKTELKINDIKDNQNLLKDLHMNSINAGQAVAEFSKKIGIDTPINPMEFASSTVAEIVNYLEGASKKELKKDKDKNILGINNWVRIFDLELKECALEDRSYKDLKDKNDSKWKLFKVDSEIADLLFDEINKEKTNGVLICLNNDPEDISNIELLVQASKYCLEKRVDKIILLQHNGFAESFIKSLNSELDAQLVLIDTPYDKDFINIIIEECKSNKKITECVYDKNKKRFEKFLKILDLENNKKELTDLNKKTILATGGGKGITFECVYALCKKYENKLIILGRSSEENDEVLKNNLQRLKNSNIDFKYIKADISDKESIESNLPKNLIDEVFCVIHGAGVNNPCSVRDLNPEKIIETLNPKVLGIKNLLEILHSVKMVVNFSSVIAVTGMEGESHYAYANSWIDWISNKIRDDINSISINWSVWSGVGMGEKLGKIDELLSKEITPISPEQGVKCFLDLISNNLNRNVVVSGRLGSKSPIEILPLFPGSLNRFTESTKIFYPNIEIVTETNLTLNEDIYLNDHCYKGEFVFPVAMGLEAIIQVSQALVGKEKIPSINELKLNRPIIADKDGNGTVLRIIALKEREKIKVALRSSQNNFQIDHFSCYVSFDEEHTEIIKKDCPVDGFNLDDSFYGQLFFQSGVFRCLESYSELDTYSCMGILSLDRVKNYFSEYLPKEIKGGDPGLRDSSIHCLQSCLPNKIVLPLSVKSWRRFDAQRTEKYIVYGRQVWEKNDEYCFDLEVFNSENEIIEIWKGLVLKELEDKNWDLINLNLLNPYINRKCKKDLGLFDFNIFITDKAEKDFMIKKCFGKEAQYEYRSDGKPLIKEGHISFSDTDALRMVVGSNSLKVSCDIEQVNEEERSWDSLLGKHYNLAKFISKETKENDLWSYTRIWSSLECVKKSGFVGEDLIFEKKIDKSLILSSFNFLIHSTIIEVKNLGLYCINILVERNK